MYAKYKDLIKCLLTDEDISNILRDPLSRHFQPIEVQLEIRHSREKFFEKFELIEDIQKYADFIEVTKNISEWIERFLSNSHEAKEYRRKFEVNFNILRIQSSADKKPFSMSEPFIHECRAEGIISENIEGNLIAKLKNRGDMAAMYDLLWSIPLKSQNCYGKLLCVLHRNKTNYIEKFCDDLHKMISDAGENEIEEVIMAYANSIVEANMNVGLTTDNNMEVNNVEPKGAAGGFQARNNGKDENMEFDCPPGNCANENGDEADLSSGSDEEDTSLKGEEVDNLFGALKNVTSDELLTLPVDIDSSKKGDTKDLKVRGYQQELAKDGIEGNNVLICAPTGSGKTIVAVKIVDEHLQKNKNGKVAFVVHRIALVEQQYVQFSKYLKCRITRLSGSVKTSSTPLIGNIPSFDVFVMTSDILRNALEQDNETKLESVGVFSMILFDECHNCDKKHPYNRIMNHYFKSVREGKQVPQIIGLTASTGTNKANTMAKAMKRLYTLCANLDCYIVSTVKDSIDELRQNQSVPIEKIDPVPPRKDDKFEVEMQKQMKNCEIMLQAMNDRGFFPKDNATQLIFSIPEDRMHQKYANFVGKLDQHLLNNTKTENEGQQAIYAISRYLNAFVRALMVNHLFRARDAINLIGDFLNLQSDSKPTCRVEELLRKNLRTLEKGDLMQSPNPCLEELRKKIEEQLTENKDSKIIVFVRERAYTQILKDVFSSLDNPDIRCGTIVGNTISAEKGGLTQNEMEEVLCRFKKGQCNVLFSTTVAEEGLDVQTCNLVIRYGHVTNETAMVQSRGRARAQDSKYLVIVPSKLQWQINKENINKYRESMMYKAIAKFQSMDKATRDKEIEECKFERQLLETIDRTKKISLIDQQQAHMTRTFQCKKCRFIICESRDIRCAENAHHIVINTEVFHTMKVNPKNKQIMCNKCSNPLGNRQSYKGRLFPNLTISSFIVVCEGQDASKSFKKWRDVDFTVEDVSNKELLDFNVAHALSS